jgi:hypothetical protein
MVCSDFEVDKLLKLGRRRILLQSDLDVSDVSRFSLSWWCGEID